jgi:sugar lactone lactonase YvrE
MSVVVECAVPGQDRHGECPLWDERAQTLWWVDSRGPAVRRWTPAANALLSFALPQVVGSIALCESGGLIAATASGLFAFDAVTGALQPIANPEAHLPDNRFNDGRCDRQGRFIAGTMSDVRRDPAGALYRFDPDGAWSRLFGDIIVPNSLAFSPDGRTLYFADTYRERISAFDYDTDTGTPSNQRLFASTVGHQGRPDGSCVDAEGYLWNCEYGGWRVVRYAPDGRIDGAIPVPAANPTCCSFGGPDFGTLYITTATQRLSAAQLADQPDAGSVFAVRPGVCGLPESRFAR